MSDFRTSAALTMLLIVPTLVLSAVPVRAEPKTSQITVSTSARQGMAGASLVYQQSLGPNISLTGPMVRLGSRTGQFDLDSSDTGTRTNTSEAYLGYQIVTEKLKYRIFLGANFRTDDTSGRGTESGPKILIQAIDGKAMDMNLIVQANYTTLHDAYGLFVRTGWSVGSISLGPEVAIAGADNYQSARLGLAASDWRLGKMNLTARAGYNFDLSNHGAGDGAYIGFGLTHQF